MKNRTTIAAHLAFWLFYGTVVGTAGYILSDGTEGWLFIANSFLFGGLVVYGNFVFILPYLLGKEYRRFGLTAFIFITAIVMLRLETEHFFGLHMTDRFGWGAYFLLTMQMLALLVLSTFFGGFLQWLNDRERQSLFQKEKLQGELKFLKTQINPHFLFNALNNIYSLAYRQDSNAAPMIATLSKIMRYHLYEGSRERVSLKKEADMLRDYIALQRLKYGDELRVDFYTEGIGPQHEIAPLLLINFVENSFKHGDAELNQDAWVNVSLSVEDGVLHFSVENSFQKPKSQAGGLGLKNAERLLDLAYPGRSSFETKSDNGVFSVHLTIEL